MNNYYTLIYLIREWKDKLKNTHFLEAISTRKNQIELFFEGETIYRMVCSTAGQHAAVFLDRYQKPQRQNTTTFFNELEGALITDVILANRDRHIRMIFEDGRELVFLMYSNHANIILSENDKIIKSFKHEKLLVNQSTPIPVMGQKSELEHPAQNLNTLIKSFDPLLPRISTRIALNKFSLPDDIDQIISHINQIKKQLLEYPVPHFTSEYGFSIIDPVFLNYTPEKDFESVNQGVAYSFFKWIKYQDFEVKRSELQKRIEKNISRTNVAISDLSHGIRTKSNAESYEKFGHLLMANQHEQIKTDNIVLDDLFDSGKPIKIPVDPTQDIISNAQRYYDKARGVKKAQESYQVRLNEFKSKLIDLESLKKSLDELEFVKDLNKWINKNETILKRIGHNESDNNQIAMPFRTFILGNYEIRVGKSATLNDELLKLSHKED
ncbi:MAG TPA: hypothetical protein DCE78_04495, partial [Bacteroidetes bacterium]|nr:hypothetical protein [Bacteroidota bacterium]